MRREQVALVIALGLVGLDALVRLGALGALVGLDALVGFVDGELAGVARAP